MVDAGVIFSIVKITVKMQAEAVAQHNKNVDKNTGRSWFDSHNQYYVKTEDVTATKMALKTNDHKVYDDDAMNWNNLIIWLLSEVSILIQFGAKDQQVLKNPKKYVKFVYLLCKRHLEPKNLSYFAT